MTVAPQLAVGTTLENVDDTSFSVFQSLQNPQAPTLVCGNFFFGLQGYIAIRIPMGEFLGLARGGNIETGLTNAALTLRSAGTWSAGGTIEVNCMIDDSPRQGPLDPRLAWKPATNFGPAWRPDAWGIFDQRLEDTGGTPFLDNGTGTVAQALLPVADVRDRLAGRFVVPAGPGWSVARALLLLRRWGNPAGTVEVAIQGNSVDAYGRNEPDGVDLGVSAAVANAAITVAPGSSVHTFAFTPDVVLAPGTYWTVFRQAVPYVPNFVDFVGWLQRRQFLGIGGAHFHSGPVGDGLDTNNYPGHVDVHFDTLAKEAGSSIIWNPPASLAVGQTFSTPDLSPLVQEVILTSGHETASALLFTLRTNGETRTYRFAGNAHATLDPPGFAAQYRRRDNRALVR